MGIILSRFRKKRSTEEILDDLDACIKDIEQYGQNTEQRHKKIVGTLIIYSVVLYIVTAMVFYFYFFPAELYDQLFYITPLLCFPLLILFTKKLVTWYYKRKISKNQEKLVSMQKEKKKILDEVTETETYKKAKEILMKFAPDQLRLSAPATPQQSIIPKSPLPSSSETPKLNASQLAIPPLLQPGTELRRRALASSASNYAANVSITNKTSLQNPLLPATPSRTGGETPLPRPILPQQRSYIDRLVEYVVGDGPNNRYALICRQCDSHNGMALKEEFEYFAFRCCYCNFWNPARKQKPSAPKLEFDGNMSLGMMTTPQKVSLQSASVVENFVESSGSKVDDNNLSDTDSDIEVVEKPSVTPDSEENNVVCDGESDVEEEAKCDDDDEKVEKVDKVESNKEVEVDL